MTVYVFSFCFSKQVSEEWQNFRKVGKALFDQKFIRKHALKSYRDKYKFREICCLCVVARWGCHKKALNAKTHKIFHSGAN